MAESQTRRHPNLGFAKSASEVTAPNRRAFAINGKKILIRGGGWSPDMMLRENSQRMEDEFRYVQDMGLNTIRLEGKLEKERVFRHGGPEGDSRHGGMVLL